MPAITALLANEAGIGRGHVLKLKEVAAGLGPRVTCVAALARSQHSEELADSCRDILMAPALTYTQEAADNPLLEGTATWGDYLAAISLAREGVIRRSLTWWREQIIAQDASILVAQYAPLALRAAQGLKDEGWAIQIISVGTGYSVPPSHLTHFPQLLPDYGRVVHPEADLLNLLNKVCAEQGMQPLTHLPALYCADPTLAGTFRFLDPYRDFRPDHERCPPSNTHAADFAGAGDEVYIYFSTRELTDPATLEAVCSLPLPRRGFFPGAAEPALARLAASGVIIEDRPVSLEDITARSRMMLHSAQHGTVGMAALAGLPQCGIPQHLEQLFNARRAGQQGILDLVDWQHRHKDAITSKIMRIYHDRAMQDRAVEFAHELRKEAAPDPQRDMAERLAPAVERAHDGV